MKSKLHLTGICKTFGTLTALDDVSLELSTGQIMALLGPSGCGKTTLLRCIAGFEVPDNGVIKIEGNNVYDAHRNIPPEKRSIGYVPQEGALFPHLNVAKNVAFGLSRTERQTNRVEEMLKMVGMEGLQKRMPHELSGGQQQRVALARALAPSPSIVLLDEPFSALDAGLRASLREDVRRTLKQAGATAIIVTHDQEEAMSMADVVSVIRSGKIIQTADPETIYHYPEDEEVASFVGEAVFLPAIVRDNEAQSIFGPLPVNQRCRIVDGEATLMIRPEQFTVGEPGEGTPARVVSNVYFGHDSLVRLHVSHSSSEMEISARILGMKRFGEGEVVGLSVKGSVMAYKA
ncbi:ABC transporter ATP-binding protein [Aneurinibacillus aneurinilyticus]|jgi:iron(III) transport system ATP-binding protein|uniref:ABC transporter ATP-binding protein n=1 Tax=Aneurinibacillus aneurinilyticus TaxID=1391 RepID=UPI0023F884A8|nr:ABC transporter ATP-binding protein [Aneurinibacillus aneurinilyticus]MCI1696691.1 ABC transporter ATP-binding protein [Aneurinibacillus aneurinilyticus]